MNFNTRPAQDALLDSTSVAWDTAARWWAVLGGQRALLLQVAHPQVAAAVSEHSNWEARSLQRLVATLRAMLRLSFGSASAASDQAEALGRVHGSIVGRTDDGVGYDADDPDAQAWVLATLIDSLWEVERRFVGRLSETDRNRSVTETRMLARSFNIDLDRFPADATEFRAWFSSRAEALQPDDRSRASALDPRPAAALGAWPCQAVWRGAGMRSAPQQCGKHSSLPAARPGEVAKILAWQRRGRRVIPRLPQTLTLNPLVPWSLRE